MDVGAPLSLPVACFGDPGSAFPCYRDAVVAIACVGVRPDEAPMPMFAASCREHRAPLRRFMADQAVAPHDPDLGVQFWPIGPFVERLNLHEQADLQWHEVVRRSA